MKDSEKKSIEADVSQMLGVNVEMPYLTDEVVENVKRAEESFTKKDRSFDCRCCGHRFTPANGQWIFHGLCNDCFVAFDSQKMCGRFKGLNGGLDEPGCTHAVHLESATEWIATRKGAA